MDDEDVEALVDLGEILIDQILERRPFEQVKALIDEGAPLWYQNEQGLSALHAAAYTLNKKLVELLIEKGAIWNAVDVLGNTAGDISLSLNDEACYRLIRDAGIRTEYLLSHLSSKGAQIESPSAILLRSEDSTAAASPSEFLKSSLKFAKDSSGQDVCLVDINGEEVGVMMGWERDIMQETVKKLCEGSGDEFKVLNVGFGLGIIDSMFQALPTPPKQHFIIEAHPDVLRHMKSLGWYEKPGVTILEGKWQEFMADDRLLSIGGFDAIYTDTFSESYQDLHDFFEHLPDLLSGPESLFSFFNGLGATNALFYDVYTQLAELHLANVGINVSWSDVDVVGDDAEVDKWNGTRRYFGMRLYRLPIGRMSTMEN